MIKKDVASWLHSRWFNGPCSFSDINKSIIQMGAAKYNSSSSWPRSWKTRLTFDTVPDRQALPLYILYVKNHGRHSFTVCSIHHGDKVCNVNPIDTHHYKF